MARLRLSMLGPLEVVLDGDPVTSLATSKARALLASLVVETGRPHPREALSGLLWPEWPERSARANLRNVLANLRKAIGDRDIAPPTLLATRETIQFNGASDCWVDVTVFQELVQAEPVDGASVRRLEQAVALYRGPFLEGFSVADSAPFEDWALVVRERLGQQVLGALQSLTGYEEARGAYARAREHTRRRVALAPWQEQGHRELMRLLALSGQRGAALAQYEACRRALREELDVEPGEGTTRLYQRIRNGELGPAKETTARDGRIPSAQEPPSPLPPHNLPAPLTPFVGRKAALAEIAQRLQDPACRLLSLVGPGGIGKTRLALEAARGEVGGYEHGVFLVPLAPVHSAEEMTTTVAQALGLPSGGGDTRRQLLSHLRDKQMLLLDNFEHMLASSVIPRRSSFRGDLSIAHGHSASPDLGGGNLYDETRDPAIASTRNNQSSPSSDDATALVSDILTTAPQVTILTTSRARLNLRSEHLFTVPGMHCPPLPAPTGGDEERGATEDASRSILAQHRARPSGQSRQRRDAACTRPAREDELRGELAGPNPREASSSLGPIPQSPIPRSFPKTP